MSASPRYLGLNDFVEEVSKALLRAPLKERYESHDLLVQDVVQAVERSLKELLGASQVSYHVWQGVAEAGGQGIAPVEAFGNTFVADLVVDVAGKPTLALVVEMVEAPQEAPQKVSSALGEAFIQAHQYPAVLLLFYSPSGAVRVQDLLDRELSMDLWSLHKVRLVARWGRG